MKNVKIILESAVFCVFYTHLPVRVPDQKNLKIYNIWVLHWSITLVSMFVGVINQWPFLLCAKVTSLYVTLSSFLKCFSKPFESKLQA